LIISDSSHHNTRSLQLSNLQRIFEHSALSQRFNPVIILKMWRGWMWRGWIIWLIVAIAPYLAKTVAPHGIWNIIKL